MLNTLSKSIFLLFILSFLVRTECRSQMNELYPDSLHKNRLRAVAIGGAAGYGITMVGLYQLWYKDFERTSFHFFDDSRDWLQMDKVGHAYSAYLLSDLTYTSLRMTGLSNEKAVLYGSLSGWLAVTSIEFFDAHYDGWGFSMADVAANTLGTALFAAQQLTYKEQRILFKYSFRRTNYAQYRPGTLGSNFIEEMTKDYNGQSYWLSANIKSFTGWNFLPDWLNIAAGYSATGLLGGSENPEFSNGTRLPVYERERQFYLSPDIDFTKIPTKHKGVKVLFKLLNTVKIPAPALRLQSGNVRFLGIYH